MCAWEPRLKTKCPPQGSLSAFYWSFVMKFIGDAEIGGAFVVGLEKLLNL